MEQRTLDWLKWRNDGLGASDAPIIMGVSPWSTPYQLWEEKTGRSVKEVSNWAMSRGNELEPRARARFELNACKDYPAKLAENPDFPFLRASLDGWCDEDKSVLEIKCPGIDDHQVALLGYVPDKYFPQLQHQLLVTGGTIAYYYSYHEDKDGTVSTALVHVLPDKDYQKELFDKLLKFWRCVKQDIEPALTDKDYKPVKDKKVLDLLLEWKKAKENFIIYEKRLEELKSEILEHADVRGKRVKCGDFRVSIVSRKGNIQYNKIPQLEGIDLEKFRGKAAVYQTISYKETKDE